MCKRDGEGFSVPPSQSPSAPALPEESLFLN